MPESPSAPGPKWLPSLYAVYLGLLQKVAEKHGYALAVHGSLTRDLDLIAIPWVDSPSAPIELVADIQRALGCERADGRPYDHSVPKPHGRRGYVIITGNGYVDLSVMSPLDPPQENTPSQESSDVWEAAAILKLLADGEAMEDFREDARRLSRTLVWRSTSTQENFSPAPEEAYQLFQTPGVVSVWNGCQFHSSAQTTQSSDPVVHRLTEHEIGAAMKAYRNAKVYAGKKSPREPIEAAVMAVLYIRAGEDT